MSKKINDMLDRFEEKYVDEEVIHSFGAGHSKDGLIINVYTENPDAVKLPKDMMFEGHKIVVHKDIRLIKQER